MEYWILLMLFDSCDYDHDPMILHKVIESSLCGRWWGSCHHSSTPWQMALGRFWPQNWPSLDSKAEARNKALPSLKHVLMPIQDLWHMTHMTKGCDRFRLFLPFSTSLSHFISLFNSVKIINTFRYHITQYLSKRNGWRRRAFSVFSGFFAFAASFGQVASSNTQSSKLRWSNKGFRYSIDSESWRV